MSMFSGKWRISLEHSTVWDAVAQAYVPDLVGEEIITIREENGRQDYEVLYGDDPVMVMGYSATFDAPEWAEYLVRRIEPKSPNEDLTVAVEQFKSRIKSTASDGSNSRNFEVGKPYGLVRLIQIDDRTQYRIAKQADGRPSNVMMRRMQEDGQAYVAYVLDTEGIVHRRRTFVRMPEPR